MGRAGGRVVERLHGWCLRASVSRMFVSEIREGKTRGLHPGLLAPLDRSDSVPIASVAVSPVSPLPHPCPSNSERERVL